MMRNYFPLFLLLLVQTAFAQDITTFPYSTGFEEIEGNLVEEYPEGWISEDLNTVDFGNQTWQSIHNSNLSQNTHSGEVALHVYSHSTETNNDWLYTPSIKMIEGEVYTLKFWYSAKLFPGTFEMIKVHLADENNAVAMLENEALWKDENVDSEEWQHAEINYIAESSGNFHFGFHYYSPEFSFILLLDDIEIDASIISSDESKDEFDFQILGNPVQSEIKISLNTNENSFAHLYSIEGRLIKSVNVPYGTRHLNMDIADLPNGSYFLKLENSKQSRTEKIIISK